MPKKSDQVPDSNDSTTGDSSGQIRDHAPLWLGHTSGEDAVQDDLVPRFKNILSWEVNRDNPITID